MKTPSLLKKFRSGRFLSDLTRRPLSWERRGEEITSRALVVTEEEMRLHRRLGAQSRAERYAN
ncbi:hypothetical protein QOL99_09085 [Deinococcus sp. MIMF12]|uniref:Uncharacterized protein n=1 Tax=Deinococcus rhizophilus TaxID=3049544 RepID=A0ABT7JGX8_9DEIO|nr:hypothetical protein [Deinococcus rhizophilus]MDL2344305.1 hypothetical protein [Deinococcus rhizophilus]